MRCQGLITGETKTHAQGLLSLRAPLSPYFALGSPHAAPVWLLPASASRQAAWISLFTAHNIRTKLTKPWGQRSLGSGFQCLVFQLQSSSLQVRSWGKQEGNIMISVSFCFIFNLTITNCFTKVYNIYGSYIYLIYKQTQVYWRIFDLHLLMGTLSITVWRDTKKQKCWKYSLLGHPASLQDNFWGSAMSKLIS